MVNSERKVICPFLIVGLVYGEALKLFRRHYSIQTEFENAAQIT